MRARRQFGGRGRGAGPLIKWCTIVASARGKRHEATNHHCEDVVGRSVHRGVHVIALADGAGTASLAREGATIAVNAAIQHVSKRFAQFALMPSLVGRQSLIEHIRRALVKETKRRAIRLSDLASTLLLAASDGQTLIVGQIGDGRVAVRCAESKAWRSALEPSRGEHANETFFATSSCYLEKFEFAVLPARQFDACTLMSDGAEVSLFNRRSQEYAKAMDTMVNWALQFPQRKVEEAIIDSLAQLMTTKTFDDLSVAMLVRSR